MVPSAYYRKDKRGQSVMIEVNRKLYLDYERMKPTEKYYDIKSLLDRMIKFAV